LQSMQATSRVTSHDKSAKKKRSKVKKTELIEGEND